MARYGMLVLTMLEERVGSNAVGQWGVQPDEFAFGAQMSVEPVSKRRLKDCGGWPRAMEML